jgi:hypothetical protein
MPDQEMPETVSSAQLYFTFCEAGLDHCLSQASTMPTTEQAFKVVAIGEAFNQVVGTEAAPSLPLLALFKVPAGHSELQSGCGGWPTLTESESDSPVLAQ